MNDNITMNQKFAEMFGLPPDTVAATLALRPGVPPCLTVTRMIYRTGQLDPTRQSDRFRLVPADDGEEVHNARAHEVPKASCAAPGCVP